MNSDIPLRSIEYIVKPQLVNSDKIYASERRNEQTAEVIWYRAIWMHIGTCG